MRTIGSYARVAETLRSYFFEELQLTEEEPGLKEILARYPQLIVVMNHGPALGALAGILSAATLYGVHGGSHRVPYGITWRGFYRLPVSRSLARYVTQARAPVEFQDALHCLKGKKINDCFIMPEGENCNFGNGRDIQPFISSRFVELAVRAGLPILVMVHSGSEKWGNSLNIPGLLSRWMKLIPHRMVQRLRESGRLSVPTWPRKLPVLQLAYQLYRPELQQSALSDDSAIRSRQIWQEAWMVQALMQQMVDGLRLEPATMKLPKLVSAAISPTGR